MSGHVFFDMPKVQQVEVLTLWLDLAGIVALDTATCSRKWRPELLDVLSSPKVTLPKKYNFRERGSEDWVIQRKVAFAEVDLCPRILTKEVIRDALLKVVGPKLKALTLSDDLDRYWTADNDAPLQIDQIFCDAAKYCHNLQRIDIDSVELDGTLSMLVNANQRLKVISIYDCANVTSGILKTIMKLPCLTELILRLSTVQDSPAAPELEPHSTCQKLLVRSCQIKPTLVAWMCHSMPNLTELSVDVQVGHELECIVRGCPHIKVASVLVDDKLADAEARMIAKHWQSIEVLVLLRAVNSKNQPVCNEAATMIFIDQCHSLLQLKLAYSGLTDQSKGSSFYDRVDYDYQNAVLSKTDNTRSRLTDLCVPGLSGQMLATILKTCVYLNTLRILRPSPVAVDSNAAEHALHYLTGSNIKTLYLKNCTNLNYAHIKPLKNMTRLLLCNSSHLEAHHIARLCQRSPELRELYIQNCSTIHYDVVLQSLDLCPQLTHFEFVAKSKEGPYEPNPAAAAAVSVLSSLVRRDYKNLKYFTVRF